MLSCKCCSAAPGRGAGVNPLRGLMCVVAAALLFASPARAGLTISGTSAFALDANEFFYSYIVELGTNTSLNASTTNGSDIVDMLEVFDFANYVPGSILWQPAGNLPQFSFATDDTIFTDASAAAFYPPLSSRDSATVRNLKITYNGAGFTNNSAGVIQIGMLSARSTAAPSSTGVYLASGTGPGGFSTVNFSGATVPVAAGGQVALPEPGSLGLLLIGALGICRRRQR